MREKRRKKSGKGSGEVETLQRWVSLMNCVTLKAIVKVAATLILLHHSQNLKISLNKSIFVLEYLSGDQPKKVAVFEGKRNDPAVNPIVKEELLMIRSVTPRENERSDEAWAGWLEQNTVSLCRTGTACH